MAVNPSAAYGLFSDGAVLNEVLQTLDRGGVTKESICMMISPTHPIATAVREARVGSVDREENAVSTGLIGWLSEFGAVMIPTFGFFIRSREFFHALVVERDLLGRCGHLGSLIRLGFPERDAHRFESHIREVGVLLYVSCPEPVKTEWALELLRCTGAQEAGLLGGDAAMHAAA